MPTTGYSKSDKRQRFIDGLRDALGDSVSPTPARAKLNRGKQSNFLLAIMLNPFARHSEGKALTDLEKRFVDGFQQIGYSDAEFTTIGRIKDEPQFGIAVSDGKTGERYTSEEFSMGTGYFRSFKPNRIWDHDLRGNGLVITLDAWEQDNGGGFEKK